MNRYEKAASLIASKLTKEELVELHEVMEGDPSVSLFQAVARETAKAAPELFVPPTASPGKKRKPAGCPKKCGQPAEKSHACPFLSDVENDQTKCRCCADCQNACADEV